MTFEERMRELPEKAGVDALVAVSPENFAFVAQTYIMTTRTLPPRQAFAILPREGEPVALDCSIEHAHVDEESWIRTARTYTEFTDHPMDALADALEEIGLRHGRLGIDLQFLSQASYAKLAGRLPGLDIVDTTDVVARARMIKTEDEVARVEFGLKSTHAAAIESMERSRLGESEKVMADRLVTGMIANGADGTMFLIFGTGPRNQERFVFFQIGANKVMILPPALAAEDIVADTIENSVAIACRRHKPNVSEKLRYRHGKKRLEIDVAVREGQEIVVFEAMAKILTAASRAGHMMKFLDDYTNSFLALLRQLVPYDGHIKLGQSLLTGHDNDSAALRVTKIAVSPLSFGPASDHRQRRQKTGL